MWSPPSSGLGEIISANARLVSLPFDMRSRQHRLHHMGWAGYRHGEALFPARARHFLEIHKREWRGRPAVRNTQPETPFSTSFCTHSRGSGILWPLVPRLGVHYHALEPWILLPLAAWGGAEGPRQPLSLSHIPASSRRSACWKTSDHTEQNQVSQVQASLASPKPSHWQMAHHKQTYRQQPRLASETTQMTHGFVRKMTVIFFKPLNFERLCYKAAANDLLTEASQTSSILLCLKTDRLNLGKTWTPDHQEPYWQNNNNNKPDWQPRAISFPRHVLGETSLWLRKLLRACIQGLPKNEISWLQSTNKPLQNEIDKCLIKRLQNIAFYQLVTCNCQ